MTPARAPIRAVSRPKVIAAFAAIYLIWGSTYLGIRIAIETMPPLLMAGVRHLSAGVVLFAVCRALRMAAPKPRHWLSALAIGGLMLLGGNGAVSWAEQLVPSGLAALVIATVPLWIALLEWRIKGVRPGRQAMAGIALGLAGVAVLIGPSRLLGGHAPNPIGVTVLLLGAFAWSLGSLYSRRAPLPPQPLLVVSTQMIAGGSLLLVAGLATGEAGACTSRRCRRARSSPSPTSSSSVRSSATPPTSGCYASRPRSAWRPTRS